MQHSPLFAPRSEIRYNERCWKLKAGKTWKKRQNSPNLFHGNHFHGAARTRGTLDRPRNQYLIKMQTPRILEIWFSLHVPSISGPGASKVLRRERIRLGILRIWESPDSTKSFFPLNPNFPAKTQRLGCSPRRTPLRNAGIGWRRARGHNYSKDGQKSWEDNGNGAGRYLLYGCNYVKLANEDNAVQMESVLSQAARWLGTEGVEGNCLITWVSSGFLLAAEECCERWR